MAQGGAPGWVGLAVADNLAAALMDYSRLDAKSGARTYPLAVFTWRESASAARGEGLDPRQPLAAAQVQILTHGLGARYVFTGDYRPKGGKAGALVFSWRIVDAENQRPIAEHKVVTNLATLSRQVDALVAAVLRALGERPPAMVATKRHAVPIAALTAYGRGLEVLAGQSLDPSARVVLPGMELKKAQLLFERTTTLAPRFARGWVALGITSAMLGEDSRAEKEVLRALTDTDDFEALDALGPYYVHMRRGQPEDAIRVLADATARRPGFLLGLGYLGSANLGQARPLQAAELFSTYAARVPKSPWAHLMHARALAFAGQHDAAIAETRAVLDASPHSLSAISGLGARLGQAGRLQEAADTLEGGLALFAENPALLTRLAWVEVQLGHADLGLDLATRAIAVLGDARGEAMAGQAYASLGHALAILGRTFEAQAAFAKAAALGLGVEERLLLVADSRVKKVLQESKSPLLADVTVGSAAKDPESGDDLSETEDIETMDADDSAGDDEQVWSEEDEPESDDVDVADAGAQSR